MKPQPSYSTLQRKIRRLQAELRNTKAIREQMNWADHDRKLERTRSNFFKAMSETWEAAAWKVKKQSIEEISRLSNLLQSYKDRETDKAHRLIRSDL